jgi:hypothetical protein
MSGTIWLTADLFVMASAAALARAVATDNAPWLLVSLCTGVLGVLAYKTAIYMLIVLVIFCVAKLLRPKLPGSGLTAPAPRHDRGRSARAWLGFCFSQCAAGQARFCLRLA